MFYHIEYNSRQGGLGEAVLSALAMEKGFLVKHLFVPMVPRSGPPAVLLDRFGIASRHIVGAATALLNL